MAKLFQYLRFPKIIETNGRGLRATTNDESFVRAALELIGARAWPKPATGNFHINIKGSNLRLTVADDSEIFTSCSGC